MANVANGARCRSAMLVLPSNQPRDFQPCYGYSMTTHVLSQIDGSQINGTAVRRPNRPAVLADDWLYRYVPVPPVGRDEDGFLVEDGMSQTPDHMTQTSCWHYALRRHLPTAKVFSDLALHYDPNDNNKTLVPDLLVALRASAQAGQRGYRLPEEPVPDLIIEMLSKTTSQNDVGPKRATYEFLGIREYWLFDPKGFRLSTPLVGERLRADRYREIAANAAGWRRSEVLGLDLHVRDGELRFRDPVTGEDLSTYDEAKDRAEAEKKRADAAERELALLRRRLG